MKGLKRKSLLAVENIAYLTLLFVSLLYAWFTPGGDKYHVGFVFGFLLIGIFFDLMSLFFHSMTLATGKHMSGFPFVGLIFYAWFLIASKFSLVAYWETSPLQILQFKFCDAMLLSAFHFFCQSPLLFREWRDKQK